MTGYQKLKAENDYLWTELRFEINKYANLLFAFHQKKNERDEYIKKRNAEIDMGAWIKRHGKKE